MTRTLLICSTALATLPLTALEAVAEVDDRVVVAPPAAAVRARAARRVADVTIDGVLGDPGWSAATITRGFVQRFPDEGKPPAQDTEFQVVYDDQAIYVGIRAFDAEPEAIRGLLTRRDTPSASDWILIGFDSYHDRRTAYIFGINPAGVQRDEIAFNDAETDASWDAVWTASARVDEQGWVAEFRIPLSQLRFSAADRQEWGFQIHRAVARTGEESTWSPWPRAGGRVVSVFGTLEAIDDVRPSRRLEVLPYTSFGVQRPVSDPADPFYDRFEGRFAGGVDVKYGLSSSFTLAAAMNPDFGQVEADPSQVNLSGQESFFAEKRPFFLEGTDIYRYGLTQGDGNGAAEGLFYTRRIGAAPHVSGGDFASYHDTPDNTTIYGAAKIGGKTASGWSVGLLEAVTAEERARLDEGDGRPEERVVEPLTNYAVLRVLKDYRGGATQVGGIVTAVHRRLDGTDLDWLLHDQGYAAGVDVSHRFRDDRWAANAKVYGTYVHGTADAIYDDQLQIRHLFQRTDATHLTLDPTRTSLSGAGLLWDVGRQNHPHWVYALGGDLRSPEVEVNDLGFQHGADNMVQWAWLGYRDNTPGRYLLSWMTNSNAWAWSDFEPRLGGFGGDTNVNATLRNHWNLGIGVNLERTRWNTALLRGGPRVHGQDSQNAWVNVGTDGRKRISAGVNANVGRRAASDSWQASVGGGVSIQARSNLEIGIEPSVFVAYDDTQYVTETADAAGAAHYILARLHQVVVATTVRAAWTFSPRLSLQLYAQPFVAAGDYGEYKEPDDPYAAAYDRRFRVFGAGDVMTTADDVVLIDTDGDGSVDVGFDRPDFDVRELRSTVVLRWEYRPGSAIFAIWSHGRSSYEVDGRFRPGHDVGELARADGEHVVMLKANYWIGL